VKNKRDLANFSARKEDAPRLGNFLELRNLLVGVYLVTFFLYPGSRQLEYIDPGTGWDKSFATSS